jgi:hypothetical protein
MKKTVTLLLLITLVILSGCSKNDNSLPASSDGDRDYPPTDKTVKVDTFNFNDTQLNNMNVIQADMTFDKDNTYNTVEELYEANDAVVESIVEKVENWDGDGYGHTIYTLRVNRCYKGTLVEPNTFITVCTTGGYCRLSSYIKNFGGERFAELSQEEIDKTIFQYSDGSPLPKVGDTLVVALFADPYDTLLPKGTFKDNGFEGRFYSAEGLKYNQFNYGKGGDKLTRYEPEPGYYDEYDIATGKSTKTQQEFTFEELDKKLEELKKTSDAKAKE